MITLIASTLFVLIGSYLFRRFTNRVSPNIPYAGSDSLWDRLKVPVEYGIDPVGFLAKQREKLGDVFCVDLFLVKIVFFLGSDGNKVVLRAAEDQLSFWEGLRWLTGGLWDHSLDYLDWPDKSLKSVKLGFLKQDRIIAHGSDTVGLADEYFAKWSKQGDVPLFHSISYLVTAHLFVIMLGEDFYHKHGQELIPAMSQFERDLQHPLLRLLPGALWGWCSAGSRILKSDKRFDQLVRAEVADIYSNPDKHRGRTDYLYFTSQLNGLNYIPVYGNHVMSMIFGGHANAAMSIPWMFLHARRVPGAIELWREEVGLGHDAKKPFLDACFRETARLYTNVSMMRRTKSAVTVAGFDLAPGTMVACSPLASQRNSSVFEKPTSWKPERFLANGAYAEWFQKTEFVHFGLGQHACPGEKLARLLIFDSILKTWLEKYDVEVVGGLEEGTKGIDGVGAEAAWTEENFGTPAVRGKDVRVKITKRMPR
ncbi:cytochrome P450 [Rickenella mellea]|uniref:Cytochrome P450 n=1 Tax=Rickenella mellea TaxID=50990 RepID=A0A4Y7PXK5_9AGAM|nr:cytochrome P450 [Rickenella mellea]